MNVKHIHNRAFLILTSLWEVGKSCRAGRYSCDRAEAARRVKRRWSGGFGRARSEGAAGDWEGKEGILWGMPGESRGTLRAAPCACVELISSPPTPPLLTPSLLSSLPLSRSRVLAAPEESTDSLGTWPRCLFALTYPLLFTAASLSLFLSFTLLSFSTSLSFRLFSSFLARFLSVSPLSSRFPTFSFLHCCVLCIPDAGTY